MITSGLMGFRQSGIDKITYNHRDSDPSRLGQKMVEWLRTRTDEELLCIVNNIFLLNQNAKPQAWLVKWAQENDLPDPNVSIRPYDDDTYCLLYKLQGHPEKWDEALDKPFYMIDSQTFILDSLFCEYAYIVNMDTRCLEIWKGSQKKRNRTNRYGTKGEQSYRGDWYYPCDKVLGIPLCEVRSQSVDDLVKRMCSACKCNA